MKTVFSTGVEESPPVKAGFFNRPLQRRVVCGLVWVALMLTGIDAFGHQKIWPGRQLKETLPQATRFTSQQVALNAAQIEKIERDLNTRLTSEDRRPTFYPAYQGDKKIGMVIFVDENGENGIIEIGMALDTEGKITGVKILAHREKSSIKQESFLGQFVGKSSQDFSMTDSHIAPLNDALEASNAVIRGVRKALLLKQEVFGN